MALHLVEQDREQQASGQREFHVVASYRMAITRRETIRARYEGRVVTLWPYALGWRGPEVHVLGLLMPDEAPGRRPPIVVQWYRVADLQLLSVQKRYWIAANVKAALRAAFMDRIEMPGSGAGPRA